MRRAGLLVLFLIAAGTLDAQAVIGQSAFDPHPIQTIDAQTGQVHTLYATGTNLFAAASALDAAGQRLFLRAGTPDFPIFVVMDLTSGDVTTYPFPDIGDPWVISLFEYDAANDRVVVNDGYDRFYEVDPETGAFQLIATIDFGAEDGLFRAHRSALDGNRVFFLTQSTLYIGDLVTSNVETRALPPLAYPLLYAFLHFDPVTGRLLTAAIAQEQPVPPNPLRPVTVSWIDPATGLLTPVTTTVPIGHRPDPLGSAFAPDQRSLFFLTIDDSSSSARLQLNTVNVSTGAHSIAVVHPYDTNYPWLEFWAQAHAGATVPALSLPMLLLFCAVLGVVALRRV